MSRWEFMRQLEELLSDIAPAEREEAVQYYNDYFNDAGRENEQEVIRALGSPEQVAQIVKDGFAESGQGEFTEAGFVSGNERQNEVVKHFGDTAQTKQNDTYIGNDKNVNQQTGTNASAGQNNKGAKIKEEMPTWAIVLIVIGCIIFSPVILGILTSVAGTLFGLLVGALALILAFFLVTVVLFIVAVLLIIEGIGTIISSPLIAIGLIGAGCICGAIAILFMVLAVLLAGKGIPAAIRGIQYLYHKIGDKKKGE